MQAESSKFASLLFDQGFQIVIPPRSPASVPEPIRAPSDGILHRYNTKVVTNDPPAPSGGDWVAHPTTARGCWRVISGHYFELLTLP